MKHTINALRTLTPSVFDEKYILGFSLIGTGINICFSLFSFFVLHNFLGGCINGLSSVGLASVIFIRRRQLINRFVSENLLVGIAYITFFLLSYRSGGIVSAIIPYYAAINMFSLTVNSKKTAVFWTSIGLLSMAYFWIEQSFFHQVFPNDYVGVWYYTWFFFCILGVYLLGVKVVGVIEERNAEFINALKEKNEELQKSHEAILQLQRYKENFLANITHELRTPLNAIKGISELLSLPNDENEKIELIDGLKKSSNHLLNMVNDILDFSKLKEGKLQLRHQPFQLQDTIKAACRLLKINANDKGLVFQLEMNNLPKTVMGDESRLIQILVNIVGNSIKFTNSGTIKVACYTKYLDSNKCSLQIKMSDTGIGISKEKIKVIFDDYVQADENIAAQFGGTGLGLGITKRLIELHQGTIQCESELAKGTIFFVEIPYEFSATNYVAASNKNNFEAIENETINIIIADDNKMNILVAQKLIEKSIPKAKLYIAENGKEVLAILKNNLIDLILMDIKMPEMDGKEAATIIRSNHQLQQPRIIAMTAGTSDDDISDCYQSGMDDYLAKPFHKEDLLNKIQQTILQRNKKQMEMEN